jgi:erythromycin esterase
MKKTILLSTLILNFTFLFGQLKKSNINENIDKIAIGIKSVELSTENSDIAKIWGNIGDSKIIGLGEGTHGTSDFFKLKNRVIKYGIEKKHFKIILIEESFSNVFKLNEFVKNGKGTAIKSLNEFGAWIYRTQELVELVEYIKEYNKDKIEKDKVSFLGFDVQSIIGVLKELKENSTYKDNKIENTIIKLDTLGKNYALFDFWKEDIQRDIKTIMTYLKSIELENNEKKIINELMILQLQNGLELWTNKNKWEDFGEKRDSLMANSISEILRITGNTKGFLWGHNGHIMKCKEGSYKSMGLILSEKYKSNYYAIGFDFNKGCFKAYDMKNRKCEDFCVNDAEIGTTASIFKKSKNKSFYLDLKKSMQNKYIAEFLKSTPHYRQVQSTYDETIIENVYTGRGEEKIKLWEFYDGWIFINETTASKFYE